MERLTWDEGEVSAVWNRAPEARAVLILAHGAGGDLNDVLLKAVAEGLASEGIDVLRFNFPYRESGRRAPGAQRQSETCYRAVADAARDGMPLFCGGKSYGGRIASHIAADGFAVDGLVFVSYPLHPPGKPDRLRDEHLCNIEAPMLFVQGTKDPFAQPDLLTRTIASLGRATHVPVEGGDHSLRVRGRSRADVASVVTREIASFIDGG